MDLSVASWWEGPDLALLWPTGVVILPEATSARIAAECWHLLGADARLGEVIETLASTFGATVLNLPPFAIAIVDRGIAHVAARGDFDVVIEAAGDHVVVSGAGVVTWSERTVPGVRSVAVKRSGSQPVGGPPLPSLGGVLRVGQVQVGGGPAARVALRPVALEVADAAPADAGHPFVPEPAVPAAVEESRSAPGNLNVGLRPEPAVSHTMLPLDEDEDPVGSVGQGFGESISEATPVALSPQRDDADMGPFLGQSTPPEDPAVADYAYLWDHTVGSPVEAAAIREVEEAPLPARAPGLVESVRWDSGGSVLDADPVLAQNPLTHVVDPLAETEDLGDHDGRTLASALLLPGRVAGAGVNGTAPDSAEGGQARGRVLALRCAVGHLSPPHAARCRECGLSLDGLRPGQFAQPVLGILVTSTGERVPLSQPVLVGRTPRASRVQGLVLPRLLPLPYPHVSGTHLEVRLEGWTVLAVDLGSRNGTFLRRRGEPPVAVLKQPVLLSDGDVLDLGHGARLSFEGLP